MPSLASRPPRLSSSTVKVVVDPDVMEPQCHQDKLLKGVWDGRAGGAGQVVAALRRIPFDQRHVEFLVARGCCRA